jgi:DNA-binding winged helix-turn-helix (wHTH) protein
METKIEGKTLSGHIWRFSGCEFDDLRMELRVGGRETRLEPKPLEMLQVLVSRPGEVITKHELLDAVWRDEAVVEGVLTTNMNKLRDAIGDSEKKIILTMRGIGYKFTGSVQREKATSVVEEAPDISQGSPVPGREQWRLKERLDKRDEGGGVWLAEHTKTHELRVFKFALDSERLNSLKQEATLSRVLHPESSRRPEFTRVLEWNFVNYPFFLESEFGGKNLAQWAEDMGGLAAIPINTRLKIIVETAKAVAIAHGLGVLHKDLKPENILINDTKDSQIEVRLADFGCGILLSPLRLKDLNISLLGQAAEDRTGLSGTLMYCAPEVLMGNPSTASSDVFALGTLLYQILVGNFQLPITSGWEASIEDPLLREDISSAASGDPAKRISTASELAQRLQNLEIRRKRLQEATQLEKRARDAERKLEINRGRRPWIVASAAVLFVWLVTSSVLYLRAARERNRANFQMAIAESIDQFLAQDLLGRTDPMVAGKPDETLLGALKQAAPDIDRQFGAAPLIAAQLHSTIALALGRRDDTEGAVREFMASANRFVEAQGELSEDAITERLKATLALSRTFKPENLEKAKQIVAAQTALIARIHNPRPEFAVYIATARAYIAYFSSDLKEAVVQAQLANDKVAQAPSLDESSRAGLKHLLAAAYMRLGENQKAELLMKDVIATYTRLYGPQSSLLLQMKIPLAELLAHEGRFREAIELTTEAYPGFVKVFGESNDFTLQVLAIRALSESSMEQWDPAIQDEATIHVMAVKADPHGGFATVAYSDLALYQCQAGRHSQGTSTAISAYEQTKKVFASRRDFIDSTAFTLAFCFIGVGKMNEAAVLLDKIDASSVSQSQGDPSFGANLALAKAQVSLALGNRKEAGKQLASAQQVFRQLSPTPYQKRWLANVQSAWGKTV